MGRRISVRRNGCGVARGTDPGVVIGFVVWEVRTGFVHPVFGSGCVWVVAAEGGVVFVDGFGAGGT